ncbi:NAD(P)-dependent oxidoreductase [Devosia ginsengisoli]|uniref:NAD-dependent epimerase/dehydratase family protein n=1 Tax=Devosia ginsengisoli TaxID=400770 RepID=UPI0026EB4E9A|nr:NAD(P)-dependent oxidoreductase [Devosia ginsengisoli]MCR6673120.1 NAD(P)-dependent oxidoreductase [Devosia ginsengisoli]
MPQILLTGASGRLGTHLRHWFTAQGRAFLATDIVPAPDGAPVEIADLADRAAVDRLMAQDISAVIHFGGMSKEAGWQTVLEANIMGSYNIFESARKAGVPRIIFASSYHVQGMYPTDETPIALTDPYRPDLALRRLQGLWRNPQPALFRQVRHRMPGRPHLYRRPARHHPRSPPLVQSR